MTEIFEKLSKLWNDKGFEILVVVSLIVIFVLAIFRKGKNGTWSTSYNYIPGTKYGNGYGNGYKYKRKGPPRVSKGELECRRVLQKLFNKPFNSCRPDFLRNPVTGGRHNLEIDCYDDELKLGVEYSGVQHYKYVHYFHKNKEAFRNQGYRDELKRRICRDNRVNLIEVPYTVKLGDIEKYLTDKLRMIGYIR